MMKQLVLAALALCLVSVEKLEAHCQMPCGIYNDDMIYDYIDQYIKTMYKGVSVMNNSKFSNPQERNEFIRWVIEKEKKSDEIAAMITQYFLQQKIKGGEPDTAKRLASAHNLLCTLVTIKQHSSTEFIEEFSKEWDKFKLMFHSEGYECEMEKMKLEKEKAAREKEHDHS